MILQDMDLKNPFFGCVQTMTTKWQGQNDGTNSRLDRKRREHRNTRRKIQKTIIGQEQDEAITIQDKKIPKQQTP
jgi:hypothetical protein